MGGGGGKGRGGQKRVGFPGTETGQKTTGIVSCRWLEVEIRLIAPRDISDMKKSLANRLQNIIIFDIKRNSQLAVFHISFHELVIVTVPVESVEDSELLLGEGNVSP